MDTGDVGLSGDTREKRLQNSLLGVATTSFPHELSPRAPFPQSSFSSCVEGAVAGVGQGLQEITELSSGACNTVLLWKSTLQDMF